MKLAPLGFAVLSTWIFVPEFSAGAKAQGLSSVQIGAPGGVIVEQSAGTPIPISPAHVVFGFAASSEGSISVTMPGFKSASQRGGASIALDGRFSEQIRSGTTSGDETMSISAGQVSAGSVFYKVESPLTLIIAQYN